jgi:hypothetical protein
VPARRSGTMVTCPRRWGSTAGEVATIMGALADLRVGVDHIQAILEDEDEAEEEGEDEP